MMSTRRVSIRLRLTALVIGSATLALIIAIALLSTARMLDKRTESERTLGRLADLIGDLITPPLQAKDSGLALQIIDAAVGRFAGTSMRIYSEDGTLLGATPRSAPDLSLSDIKLHQAENREQLVPSRLVAVAPIIVNLETIGYIAVDANPPGARAGLGATLALGPVALLVGIVIVWATIARVQGPRLRLITRLARLSREVTLGHNTSQHVVKHVHDEIGDLVDGFNSLLDQIGIRDLAIERRRRDVDRVLEARRVLQVEKAAAQADGRRQAAFLALISDGTRATLTDISDAAARLGGVHLSTDQQRAVQIVQSRTQYLLQMSESLSRLSAPNATAQEDGHVDFQPSEMLESIVDTFAERAHSGNVDIIWHVDSEVPRVVRGDAAGIQHALSTLVANAVKGTELGHVALVVGTLDKTVRPPAPGSFHWRVSVTSIGPGMLDVARPHGGASPSDTEKSNNTGGLAIAIAKHQATALEGHVDHAVIPGGGAASWITVPVKSSLKHAQPQQRVITATRVLLLEASRAMREILAQRLESLGLMVTTAFGIGSACELLTDALKRDQHYDCLIVSVQGLIDEFDGLSRGFAENSGVGSTPLIVLARRHVVVPDSAFELGGGVMVLRTPLRNAELLKALEQVQRIGANTPKPASAQSVPMSGHDQPSHHFAESAQGLRSPASPHNDGAPDTVMMIRPAANVGADSAPIPPPDHSRTRIPIRESDD